jgi:hypothetical protein
MSISVDKVRFSTDEEANSVVVTMEVELTEEELIMYINLDELVRKHEDNTDVTDWLSDYGWSYSNNVLCTRNWDTLEVVLNEVKSIVKMSQF